MTTATKSPRSPQAGRFEPDYDRAARMQRTTEIINAAIADGTHGPARTVCDGCREWVDGIYHVNEQGTRLCFDCTPEPCRGILPGKKMR